MSDDVAEVQIERFEGVWVHAGRAWIENDKIYDYWDELKVAALQNDTPVRIYLPRSQVTYEFNPRKNV